MNQVCDYYKQKEQELPKLKEFLDDWKEVMKIYYFIKGENSND